MLHMTVPNLFKYPLPLHSFIPIPTKKMKNFCVPLPCVLILSLFLLVLGTSEAAKVNELQNLETKGGYGEENGVADVEGLILNADYSGVSTHPSPLPKGPKHPKP